MMIPRRNTLIALPLAVVAVLASLANAVTYDVSASGDGMDLFEAIELAEAGDTIFLADGTYDTPLVTERDGKKGNPITFEGSKDAVINGVVNSRSVPIKHSFITLRVSLPPVLFSTYEMNYYVVQQCLFASQLSPPGLTRC